MVAEKKRKRPERAPQPDDDSSSDSSESSAPDSNAEEPETRVYLPGGELGEGEVLVADQSAYEVLHTITPEWPCLSFDFVRDALGDGRTQPPFATYLVAGTQADEPGKNRIHMMKASNLSRTRRNDDSSESDDDEASGPAREPVLVHRAVRHVGGVNRIRAANAGDACLVASWADTGSVHVFDLAAERDALDGMHAAGQTACDSDAAPLFTLQRHREEGFALDWAVRAGAPRLLSGDCAGAIYLSSAASGRFEADAKPFSGHAGSVEDLQWSPSEAQVFASCGTDGTVRVWDARVKKASQLSVRASEVDVNVIHWNRTVDYLLASGDDRGEFKIWDLRAVASDGAAKEAPAAAFRWHTDAITSIEWAPHESSMLAVAGADDQVTLWDLSLEADPEALRLANAAAPDMEIPPQLLFVHQGQTHIKEVHWHAQCPGLLGTTALEGFNVFKTINS